MPALKRKTASGWGYVAPGSSGFVQKNTIVLDVKDYGAVDGVTDDTAAIQAAIDAVPTTTPIVLLVTGPLLLDANHSQFGVTWAIGITRDNVTVKCLPGGKIIRTQASGTPFFASGAGKPSGLSSWNSYRYTDATVYPISSVSKGAVTVTCTTPADAGNFAVGDYIYLRTGHLTSNAYSSWPETDAETFKVVSANASTGVITLSRPTGKAYAQEYFANSSMNSATTTTSTAYPAAFGVSKVTDRTIKNITFEDVEFDCASTDRNVISAWQVYGLRILRPRGRSASGLQTGRDITGLWIEDSEFHQYGNSAGQGYMICGASGTSDMWSTRSKFTMEAFRYIHVHEGVVRFRSVDDSVLNGAPASSDAAFHFGSRGYDATVRSPHIANAGYGVFVDSTCTGGGSISDVKMSGSILTSAFNVAPTGWSYDQPDSPVGTAKFGTGGTAAGPGTPRVISAHVTYNTATRTIGPLPANAVILGIKVIVTTAFNGGTNTLTIGIGGDTSRYMAAVTALTSTGEVASIPAGSGSAPGPYVPSRQTAQAFFSSSGPAATAGEAIVLIEYVIAGSA